MENVMKSPNEVLPAPRASDIKGVLKVKNVNSMIEEKKVPKASNSKVNVKGREELYQLYNDGLAYTKSLHSALERHRTQSFFKPDIPFMKGVSAAILSIESSMFKFGKTFNRSNVVDVGAELIDSFEEEPLKTKISLTPPPSESGHDATNTCDTSNNSENSFHSTKNSIVSVPQPSGSIETVLMKSPSSSDSYANKPIRNKRKRTSLDSNILTVKTELPSSSTTAKKSRRSLLAQYFETNPVANTTIVQKSDEVIPETEAETVEQSEGGKEEEFEVDKILDYDRKRGKCLYQVRWRNYGPKDDTWEPLENLTGCEEILCSFIRQRLLERSRVKNPEDLKSLLLPCTGEAKDLLRQAFFAQQKEPSEEEVTKSLPILLAGRVKVKSLSELEEDADRLLAIKDSLSEKYTKSYSDFKLQLSLIECKKRRDRQSADLRRWEREMSKICSAPAPLHVVNDVDLTLPPTDFVYINKYIAGKGITIPEDPLLGCECSDCFTNQNSCCAAQMGSFYPYNKTGRLKVSLGTAIYECNKNCACVKSGNCNNRVVQKGRTSQLTIFRTANDRGWGVRSNEFIKSGSFVVEYVGEVISSEEAERRGQYYDARGCTYLFDLDFNKGDQNPYTVDAAKYGNISHFINHSCDPNLVVYNVWVNCLDPDLPRLALFASRDIKKGEEITFDYNSPCCANKTKEINVEEEFNPTSPERAKDTGSLDQAITRTPKRGILNGKTRCHCGAANCREFFF